MDTHVVYNIVVVQKIAMLEKEHGRDYQKYSESTLIELIKLYRSLADLNLSQLDTIVSRAVANVLLLELAKKSDHDLIEQTINKVTLYNHFYTCTFTIRNNKVIKEKVSHKGAITITEF